MDEDPGTTRDYLEDLIERRGILMTLVDTAGLREGGDRLEARGMDLALQAVAGADVVVLVIDARGMGVGPLGRLKEASGTARIVAAVNKADLPERPDPSTIEALRPAPVLTVSALTGQGVDDLADAIAGDDAASAGAEEAMLACERHRSLVAAAALDARQALDALGKGLPDEVVAAGLRSAIGFLDELTGREVVPDVLDEIFSRFCVGK